MLFPLFQNSQKLKSNFENNLISTIHKTADRILPHNS